MMMEAAAMESKKTHGLLAQQMKRNFEAQGQPLMPIVNSVQHQNLTFDELCRGAYVNANAKMTQKRTGQTGGVVPTVNKTAQNTIV